MSSRQSRRQPRGKGQTRAKVRQGNQPKNRSMLYIGGAAVVLIALVVFGIFRAIPGTKASDFEIVAYTGQETLGGDEINFISLLDQGKPIILNFWAGNCPPCRAEMPGFQSLYEAEGDDFILLGVDVGPFTGLVSHHDATQFLSEFGITYPTGFAKDSKPVRDYGVQAMPTTVFITPDGEITRNWQGFLSQDNLKAQLTLLRQKSVETDPTS